MHTVKCSDCGGEAQVPFKPPEGRPVYCRDCYPKHKDERFILSGGCEISALTPKENLRAMSEAAKL